MESSLKIEQTMVLPGSPNQVYLALMDPERHAAFTGAKAVINAHENGRFSVYDGGLVGTFLKLAPGRLIECTWKSIEDDWPAEVYSRLKIKLQPEGEGTKLTLTQTGVPTTAHKAIEQGWHTYYWEPLKVYLERSR